MQPDFSTKHTARVNPSKYLAQHLCEKKGMSNCSSCSSQMSYISQPRSYVTSLHHPVYLWLAKTFVKDFDRFTTLCIYRFRAQELHYDKDDVRMTLFRKFCQGSMANREKTLIERQLSKGTAIAQKAGKRWYSG